MICIPGGEYVIGTDSEAGSPLDGEGPARSVLIDSFYIDQFAVTNFQFEAFVNETGYKTDAEKFGWSFVFYRFLPEKGRYRVVSGTPWWRVVENAVWFQPEGRGSSIKDRLDHPVTHVSWNDAQAYCEWGGKRLPTEAEWEIAASGGKGHFQYPWGSDLLPDGEHRCNIWQGNFPSENTEDDGYEGTCPVGTYSPNGFDLYNMVGNVWEWCSDWFTPGYHKMGRRKNPVGPLHGTEKVIKGGSYLCHSSYCNRYRTAARSSNTIDSSTGNLGFRCAVSLFEK